MTKAWGPVRRFGMDEARPRDEEHDTRAEESAPPGAAPVANRAQNRAFPGYITPPHGRVYPRAHDSRGSEF